MILYERAVTRCIEMNYRNQSYPFITRDVAQTIASWHVSTANADKPLKDFADGRRLDAQAVAARAAELADAVGDPATEEQLRALSDWAENER